MFRESAFTGGGWWAGRRHWAAVTADGQLMSLTCWRRSGWSIPSGGTACPWRGAWTGSGAGRRWTRCSVCSHRTRTGTGSPCIRGTGSRPTWREGIGDASFSQLPQLPKRSQAFDTIYNIVSGHTIYILLFLSLLSNIWAVRCFQASPTTSLPTYILLLHYKQ